jgi:hypothetical protein
MSWPDTSLMLSHVEASHVWCLMRCAHRAHAAAVAAQQAVGRLEVTMQRALAAAGAAA